LHERKAFCVLIILFSPAAVLFNLKTECRTELAGKVRKVHHEFVHVERGLTPRSKRRGVVPSRLASSKK
jgi:hypothetical protein